MFTRTNFDRQYEHIGNIRHGVQTGPWRVEFDAPVKDDSDSRLIVQGALVSLDADGNFIRGAAAGDGHNHPVPMIAMKNIADPDVTAGYTSAKAIGSGSYSGDTYSAVGGVITAIPCTSGYELETTEFVAGTYKPNDCVIAATTGDKGKVKVGTMNPGKTEVVVGFVSKVPGKDYLGNQRLAFFAHFIPANVAKA